MMRRTIHHLRLLQSVLALAIISVLALTTPGLLRADDNPRLIKDVNTLTIEASSLCGQPVVANNIAYFCGGNFVLWRTDGTESGTHPVLDKDGNEFRYPDNLMELNGLLLFTAYGDTGGFIATDGSAAGTRALYDDEGRAIGSPMLPTISGGYLYFFRFNLIREDSLTFLHELWRTDGRHVEPVSLLDTRLDPNDMVSVDGELFFTNYEHELWKSDGTAQGTVLLKDLEGRNYSYDHNNLTNVNGTLYFTMEANSHVIWKSDGTTSGTVPVIAADALPEKIDMLDYVDANGNFYFAAEENYSNIAIWKSDGTAQGTQKIDLFEDLYSYAAIEYQGELYIATDTGLWKTAGDSSRMVQIFSGNTYPWSSIPTIHNNILYFSADDGLGLGQELWKTDGTVAGTTMVKDIAWQGKSSAPNYMTSLAAGLIFQANKANHLGGEALWMTDGTRKQTRLVKDISQFTEGAYPNSLTELNGDIYFLANRSRDTRNSHQQWELWRTNGTESGTQMVVNLIPERWYEKEYGDLIAFNGKLYFAGNDGSGWQLWQSDGTAAGTAPLMALLPNNAIGEITDLTVLGNQLFFFANAGTGAALWRLQAGEKTAQEIIAGLTDPKKVIAQTASFIFSNNHDELWISSGDSTNTKLYKALSLGDDTAIDYIQPLSSKVFSLRLRWNQRLGENEQYRNEALWISDGTEAGTLPLLDHYPEEIIPLNEKILYSDQSGLWVSDGTEDNAVLLTEEQASHLTKVGNQVYFNLDAQHLYKTDGTTSGTLQVAPDVYVIAMSQLNGQLYFSAYDAVDNYGYKSDSLWLRKSDGTPSGTVLVKKDIELVTSLGLQPDDHFIARTPDFSTQLWKTDGTETGTVKLANFYRTSAYGFTSGENQLISGSKLYFTASDEIKGNELWLYDFGTDHQTKTSIIGDYVWLDFDGNGT